MMSEAEWQQLLREFGAWLDTRPTPENIRHVLVGVLLAKKERQAIDRYTDQRCGSEDAPPTTRETPGASTFVQNAL